MFNFFKKIFSYENSHTENNRSLYSELNELLQNKDLEKKNLDASFSKEIATLEDALIRKLGCWENVEVEKLGKTYSVSPVYISDSIISFDRPTFENVDEVVKVYIGFYFNNHHEYIAVSVSISEGRFVYQLDSDVAEKRLVGDFIDIVLTELVGNISKETK